MCDRRSEAEVRHLVARPLSGLFFATYGDKVGRKWVLVITILLMGGASTLLGLCHRFHGLDGGVLVD